MSSTTVSEAPPLWQIEFRLCDLIAEQTAIARGHITPSSRLLEDLHIDSLELVELFLGVEEEFCVSIPDDMGKLTFVRDPATVSVLAEIVRHQWGTGKPRRDEWFVRRNVPPQPELVPFTQLDGLDHWRAGPVYEAMASTPEGYQQFRRRTDGMRCVLVPEAVVEIGDDAGEADQRPRHRVKVSAFLIDAEPVSVTAYGRFLNSLDIAPAAISEWCGVDDGDRRGEHFQLRKHFGVWKPLSGTEHQPMVLVSWLGANAYSLWANRRDMQPGARPSGECFLPTEAQWEYAARGPDWQRFPWGDSPASPGLALHGLHTARRPYGRTLPLAPVNARLGMSSFGVHHMAGNVWQWCADNYAAEFYRSAEASLPNPYCTRETGVRVERGGSWIGPAELLHSSYRRGRPPLARGRCLGFRCTGLATELPA
jgi:formylglycine-generating enzyme